MPDKKIVIVILLLLVLGIGYGIYQYSKNGFDFGPAPEIARETITLQVYFNNSELNPDMEDCGKVFLVERKVFKTKAVARAALTELFKGPTTKEKEQGYTSWFSEETNGILKRVEIQDKTAYVDLKDIRDIIPGANSSCGSEQLLAEIQSTVEQFPTVEDTIIAINGSPETFYQWIQIGCTEENNFCDPGPLKNMPEFSESGNLIKNNPGLKEGVWYLSYEEPGSPGLKVELDFTDESECSVGGEEKDCDNLNLESGVRVQVNGVKENGSVKVDKLIKE